MTKLADNYSQCQLSVIFSVTSFLESKVGGTMTVSLKLTKGGDTLISILLNLAGYYVTLFEVIN